MADGRQKCLSLWRSLRKIGTCITTYLTPRVDLNVDRIGDELGSVVDWRDGKEGSPNRASGKSACETEVSNQVDV